MPTFDLTTDDGLRAAIEGLPRERSDETERWVSRLAETIEWLRSSDKGDRVLRSFQDRLWEHNHVAAVGQGQIPVDRAIDDEGFRKWFAAETLKALPDDPQSRHVFLTGLYEELKARLEPFLAKKTPHLKIFRVMAALYPEAMTTIASSGALLKLARALGARGSLPPVERHLWVRQKIDDLLGSPGQDAKALAYRITLPWLLYENFVQSPELRTEQEESPGETSKLLPLAAARRRRGMTSVRGSFPAMLSALEFIREGVTRDELLDFLRAAAPESKTGTLGVTINAYQGELGVIRREGDRYVLTARGEDVLESQDPGALADWLLTRILGVDRAIVELRDRGAMKPGELLAAVRAANPSWTTDFVPQAILGWLRSMGVIRTTADWSHELTAEGRDWAARIHWQPESLPSDVAGESLPSPDPVPEPEGLLLPDLSDIITRVQQAGHFPPDLVARLHFGLWSHRRRHFAILTGLSGSGKTLLAREYARALTIDRTTQRLFTLPVQPGWYDPGALLGFTNPLRGESYVRTAFLEFLLEASANQQHPYVVVLDEMNLSHPEQYMAPLLSAMETGDAIQLHTEDAVFDGVPSALPYPSNLVLIGTVNMDETTHGLSDKVLDRAFVLEFWEVDLAAYPHWGKRSLAQGREARAREVLVALMGALAPARLHFGWRVVDDVLDFLVQADGAGDALSFDAALDGVVYAKVLPKIRGEDAPRLRKALEACHTALTSLGLDRSSAKVAELKHDLEITGSARFWR